MENIKEHGKGYDFDILNSLEDERLIGGSTHKAKSTYITNEGIKKAKEILTVLILFNGIEGLEESVDIAKKYLIQYANAENISSTII